MPRVDMVDWEAEIVVRAELPRVTKEDLDVSMTDDSVTSRASTQREQKEEKGEYFRRELSHREFQRTLRVPVAVKGTEVKATFKDGILELVLPKVEPAKRRDLALFAESVCSITVFYDGLVVPGALLLLGTGVWLIAALYNGENQSGEKNERLGEVFFSRFRFEWRRCWTCAQVGRVALECGNGTDGREIKTSSYSERSKNGFVHGF